jgi:hypothetical protein
MLPTLRYRNTKQFLKQVYSESAIETCLKNSVNKLQGNEINMALASLALNSFTEPMVASGKRLSASATDYTPR